MPSGSRLAPNRAKQFEARTAALVVNGNVMEDIESFGFDQSKDHELQYTIDQNAIWVKSTPELTGSFVVKETSPSIPIISKLFLRDIPFDITVRLANTAAAPEGEGFEQSERFTFPSDSDVSSQDFVQFSNVMITDWSKSDYQVDDMPTMTGEWQAVNRDDESAPDTRDSTTLAAGQISAADASQ
jgi:hypothetical protein